ncbi:MAG: mechanosensitive ion channel [Cyanobacteria bacterium SZAS LIN-3]|nr:mechanosensitive ion channel [Cyanobacteria bacterium SZAS LIN-3]MBS2007817.1 mechanosensitive ion channel [Cyanobacteria bacterium SZAS TMP-1]
MHDLHKLLLQIESIFQTPFLPIGKSTISLWHLIYVLGLFVVLVWATGWTKRSIEERLLARTNIDIGVRQTLGSFTRGLVLTVGFLIILQTAGIDLSSITVIVGALGLGISLGLQQITSNFVAGVTILLERPIKVGDRIEVDGVTGEVVKISLRATTMLTNDNISIIVPNADFVKGKITNWSYSSDLVRFSFPVPVAHSAKPQKVIDVLLDVARSHPGVVAEPAPDVVFQEYGEKALSFILRVYTRDYLNKPSSLRSELNLAIYKAFEKSGIAFAHDPAFDATIAD